MEDVMLVTKRATAGSEITPDTTRTSLNGFGVFAIIVFACVSLIVIHPLRIPVPQPIARGIRTAARKTWLFLAGPPDSSSDSENQDQDAVEREFDSTSQREERCT